MVRAHTIVSIPHFVDELVRDLMGDSTRSSKFLGLVSQPLRIDKDVPREVTPVGHRVSGNAVNFLVRDVLEDTVGLEAGVFHDLHDLLELREIQILGGLLARKKGAFHVIVQVGVGERVLDVGSSNLKGRDVIIRLTVMVLTNR